MPNTSGSFLQAMDGIDLCTYIIPMSINTQHWTYLVPINGPILVPQANLTSQQSEVRKQVVAQKNWNTLKHLSIIWMHVHLFCCLETNWIKAVGCLQQIYVEYRALKRSLQGPSRCRGKLLTSPSVHARIMEDGLDAFALRCNEVPQLCGAQCKCLQSS